MRDRFVITIDGPAGSGKSTIAKLLEERDGFLHIDTGAIYRVIGYIFNGSPNKNDILNLRFSIRKKDRIKIFWQKRDIEEFIRTEKCGMLASNAAKIEFVRDFVNDLARKIADTGKFVIDGRDCGSVIFPDAQLKIFLAADIDERARRRAKDDNVSIDDIKKDIEKRDYQDKNRSTAPLIKPEDAYEIDTTKLSIEGVYKSVKKLLEERYENNNS